MSVELVRRAVARRRDLIASLTAESTDCFRLFHGVAEGREGLTIDRYGPILLLQTWREPLSAGEMDELHRAIESTTGWTLTPVWNHRADKVRRGRVEGVDAPIGHELGIRYDVSPRHDGQDPLLFLDLRAGRRAILERARDKSVLNLFAYTGGVSVCAAHAGASEIWSVDFARAANAWTRRNLALNAIDPAHVRLVQEDVIPVVRQLAGLPVKGRGARRRYLQLEPRQFDIVVLDPPRWAKSPFGAVDVVRDYPSLLKPALLATAPGGELLITNNAARVTRDDWLQIVTRTADKCGRRLRTLDRIEPESDFPAIDGEPPLKIAWVGVA